MPVATQACQNVSRMNRKDLIAYMAEQNGVSTDEAATAYAMTTKAIRDVVARGVKLSLSGFGVFYLQKHRGHPVQFQSGDDATGDYLVFKFSASNTLNKFIREFNHAE